jgi:spore maturation protein CgeB
MISGLKLCFFAHSWRSDWNHGNAHFLRGLVYELGRRGHEVRCYEAEGSWSYLNLLQEPAATASLAQFESAFPTLDLRLYRPSTFREFAERELRDADIVVIHEWNPPQLAETILSLRDRFGYRVLFHDTHHRAYTNPKEIAQFGISSFDGVLAFGDVIRRIYERAFGARRAWTFHEAADTAHFHPLASTGTAGVNWIGNWGDEERTRELNEFLIAPLKGLNVDNAAVYGVRYPAPATALLQACGIEYRGYLPNLFAPSVYSQTALTLHIPRRYYANGLSGIPTIRIFEALACGIPTICSPWSDTENLFRVGHDYFCVPDGKAMQAEISHLLRDSGARRQLAANGLEAIHQRHTCAHRAQQFLQICEELGR